MRDDTVDPLYTAGPAPSAGNTDTKKTRAAIGEIAAH
jgi:hypothetical protein